MNSDYANILKDIFGHVETDQYIVLGSAATLSFTSQNNYKRRMNDLDVIANKSVAKQIGKKLLKKGYQQTTFINKRMPFFNKLNKYGRSMYFRYSKGNTNIEVLSTKFIRDSEFVRFDLYPGIWAKVPTSAIVITTLEKSKFTTLNVNLLWSIKQLLNNTLGKVMHYKSGQRKNDLNELKKVIDITTSKQLLAKCRFGYKGLSFKVPSFLLN